MKMGLTQIKDINYDLVDELIESTEGLNYARVKELLNDPECDVNCPRYEKIRCNLRYLFKTPFFAANDTRDLEIFKLYIECDRVDVLTWFSLRNCEDYVGWKQYYKCHCRCCEHEHVPLYLYYEFERLTYDRIKRDLVKLNGNLELLPFYVTDFCSVSFFQDSLQYITDVNAKNSYGYTLLHWVVKKNNINIEAQLAVLLERNPDASVEFPDGTPVMVTLSRSFSCNPDLLNKLARSLMIHGADIFATDSEGKNFIDFDPELEKILPFDSPLSPEIMKSYLLSPKSKNFSSLREIIAINAEARRIWLEFVPTVADERFLSCEIDEISPGMVNLFNELLNVKQDFDDEAKLKFVRIIIRKFRYYKLEDILKKFNLSEDFFKDHKDAILHECIYADRFSLVKMFLNVYNADPNSIVDGMHPLYRCKDLATCSELIKAGADPLYDDGKGKFFNRICLKIVYEPDFRNLMKLLCTKAIPIDEPNPETGETFAYILAEAGFVCPIESVNLNLVINNVPLFANLNRLDKFFELTQGREIDYLTPDSEGNTFLHRLGQFDKSDEFYFDLFAIPKMSSYFLYEKNNNGETPFVAFVMKADEDKKSFSILRKFIYALTKRNMLEELKVVMTRLKQKCKENELLLFDRICEDGLRTGFLDGSLEICKFWIEAHCVDPNTVDFPVQALVFLSEEVAIYLVQKGLKDKYALLECAFLLRWKDFLDYFVKELSPDDLDQLKIVLDGWNESVCSNLLKFLSRPEIKSHLETRQLSNLLFSRNVTIEQAQILIDLGADPLYFARTRSCFKNYRCHMIDSEVWRFFKQNGLSLDYLKQMRVFNILPFLKVLSMERPKAFQNVTQIFAQFGTSCKFQDLGNYQVIGDTELCSICRNEFIVNDDLTLLDCKHFFHTACVEYNLERHQACPYCRALSPISSIEDLSLE